MTPDAAATLGGAATFDHVAHALPSILAALPLYRDALGGELVYVADNDELGYRVVHLAFGGGTKIELLEPLPRSDFLVRFLERNPSGGLHHVTFNVGDVVEAVAAVEQAGFDTFGLQLARPEWREAFVHPRVAHGVLVQLAEIAPGFPPPMAAGTVAAVLDRTTASRG